MYKTELLVQELHLNRGGNLLVGIIVAFVVLLITFGSVIAAGLPIISALIG